MQHISPFYSTQTLYEIIHFYINQFGFLFLEIIAWLIVNTNLLIVILKFHLILINVLINVDLIISIFDINISSGWLLRVKSTAHLFGKYFLINLYYTLISMFSTLIVCFCFLINLLVVSWVILLSILLNKITVIYLKICRDLVFNSNWIL